MACQAAAALTAGGQQVEEGGVGGGKQGVGVGWVWQGRGVCILGQHRAQQAEPARLPRHLGKGLVAGRRRGGAGLRGGTAARCGAAGRGAAGFRSGAAGCGAAAAAAKIKVRDFHLLHIAAGRDARNALEPGGGLSRRGHSSGLVHACMVSGWLQAGATSTGGCACWCQR